jgi:Tol biopolymer transport system component
MVFAADDVMSPWLFAMSADGSKARILNQLPGLCADPTWSPDGAALAVGVNMFDPSVWPAMIEAAKNSSIYEKCRDPIQ